MSDPTASDIFLYWVAGSVPCWRVMVVLEEKSLVGYNQKLLSYDQLEHKSEEILRFNPRGQIPTTRIGERVINESLAVIDYIEALNTGNGPVLYPTDPVQLAMVLQRKYEALNLFHKGLEDVAYPAAEGEEVSESKKQSLRDEMCTWDHYLKQAGEGSYVAGKNFSMADVVFFPSLAFLVRVGFRLLPRFPSLKCYYNLICQRPSVKNTWPPHWKESDNSDLLADI